MRKLLNTLYVLSEDAYLKLDGENIVVMKGEETAGRFPLHTLQNILSFSYRGASPGLMGACAKRQIGLAFFSPHGRFLAATSGEIQGNVLLRREQARLADDPKKSLQLAQWMIFGKLYNSRHVLQRSMRDHSLRVDTQRLASACDSLRHALALAREAQDTDTLRGIEGQAAAAYFSVFDEMILQQKADFYFRERTRRPPTDPVNALLSFAYVMLSLACGNALSGVGLDPYVGFMHTDRPGRASLALDMAEELRSVYADRFVLTLINNRVVRDQHFLRQENGACLLTDEGRKAFFSAWQERKRETITHPFLNEKISWGLVPHVQALLLARFIRGDYEAYPPFFWK